jgi:hypothetical protein
MHAKIDTEVARRESPTTTHWFSLQGILKKGSSDLDNFRDLLFQAIGIS